MTYISYRNAFNQLGDTIFKGSWDNEELKIASLYDDTIMSNGTRIHGYIANVVKEIRHSASALSKQQAAKITEEKFLLIVKEIEEVIKNIQCNAEGTEVIKGRVQELEEMLIKWKEIKLEALKEKKHKLDVGENYTMINNYSNKVEELEQKIMYVINNKDIRLLYIAKSILGYKDGTSHEYKNIFSEEYAKHDTCKPSFNENYIKLKWFINFLENIKERKIEDDRKKIGEGIVKSLLRYHFISKFINLDEEVSIDEILNPTQENGNHIPVLYVREGDIMDEKRGGMRELPSELYAIYSADACYRRARFKLGQESDCKEQIYIKENDLGFMLNRWLPTGKIGRIEGYLRKELGYYPPWLELQIRAITHFKKTPSTEKTQINDVINWLKKDNELLQLIKLKKGQLNTKHDDMRALTKFLHHEITRKES